MPKEELLNPIRCMVCPKIVGCQGLANHMRLVHPEENRQIELQTYLNYVKKNGVKRRDIENPLRDEWRRQQTKEWKTNH